MITPKVGDYLRSPQNRVAVFLYGEGGSIQVFANKHKVGGYMWMDIKSCVEWRYATEEEILESTGLKISGTRTKRFSSNEPNISSTPKAAESILPAWLDGDCEAYVARAHKCGYAPAGSSVREKAKTTYDWLLVNYGTTSPEIAKEKDKACVAAVNALLDRRAQLLTENCSVRNRITPLGDQCRGTIRGR